MSDHPGASHDTLADLIRAAGRRASPPAQAYERALAATTVAWQGAVRRRRWRIANTLAASVAALGIGALISLRSVESPQTPAYPIATVARVLGSAQVRYSRSDEWAQLQENASELRPGAMLRTDAQSGVAVQLEQMSIRIAQNADVVLEERSRLRLARGTVYVDTGSTTVESMAGRMTGRIVVLTDAGSITDIGTRFQVQSVRDGYQVSVREGAVLVQRGTRRMRGTAGQRITLDSSGGIRNGVIAPDDPAWTWAQVLAPAPNVDNQPLTVLIEWVARETGRAVRYANPGVERRARTTIMHGSVPNLAPLDVLAVMLATTDLRHEVLADGSIVIK